MEAVRALPEIFEVIGLAEPEETRRAAAAKLPAFAGVEWKSEAELLATPGLRAVIIEQELDAACDLARRAIAAGEHVHSTNPARPRTPLSKPCARKRSAAASPCR